MEETSGQDRALDFASWYPNLQVWSRVVIHQLADSSYSMLRAFAKLASFKFEHFYFKFVDLIKYAELNMLQVYLGLHGLLITNMKYA